MSQQENKNNKVLDDEILDSMIYEVYGTNGWKQAATSTTAAKEEDEMCGGGTAESFGDFD